jgi:hypothetical protein
MLDFSKKILLSIFMPAIFLTGCGQAGNSDLSPDTSSTPTVALSSKLTNVEYNGSITVSWSSTSASKCTASGSWQGDKAITGSEVMTSLTSDAAFALTCVGADGMATDSLISTVGAAPELTPTVSLLASPAAVGVNGSTSLSWSSTNVSACTASGDWSGNMNTSGSQMINSLSADSTFVLSCLGAGGTANDSVLVTVLINNSGTALLSWLPPTSNTDNSPLTDLDGYKIYYGASSGNYSNVATVSNPGLSSYLVENLFSGTWFFAITSLNTQNIESTHSNEVSKTIN